MRGIIILSVEQHVEADERLRQHIRHLKLRMEMESELKRANQLYSMSLIREITWLRKLNYALAERIYGQSELLTKRASRANQTGDAGPVPAELEVRDRAQDQGAGGEQVRDLRGAESPLGGEAVERPGLLARLRRLLQGGAWADRMGDSPERVRHDAASPQAGPHRLHDRPSS